MSIACTTTTSAPIGAGTCDLQRPATTLCMRPVAESSRAHASAACSATTAMGRWPRDVLFEPHTTQVPGIHGIVRIDRHAARDRPLPVRRHTDVDNRYGLPCSQKLLEFRSRDAV